MASSPRGRSTPACALPLLFGLMFLLQGAPSQAGDTVAAGRPLSGGQSLVSKRGKFRLGFFQPGTGPLCIPQNCVQCSYGFVLPFGVKLSLMLFSVCISK